MASYSLMQFLFAPLWGGLADRFGNLMVLLAGVFCYAAGMLGMAYASSEAGMFATAEWTTPSSMNTGSSWLVGRAVSTLPPWSMSTETTRSPRPTA